MTAQDGAGQNRFIVVIAAAACFHQACGQQQALADALAQFLRGGFGEGHGQDLADAQSALDHQPGEQRGQGESLAGTGAGFDQAHAFQWQRQIRVVGGRHRGHACSNSPKATSGLPQQTASKMRWLLCANSA